MEPIVSFKEVFLSIGDKRILTNVNFHVEKNEKLFILGGDGAGKSTLLKILAGLIKCQEGEILIFEKNLKNLSRKEIVQVRKKLGFVFQEGALAANLTALENLMLPMRYHAIYDDALVSNVAMELLEMIGMKDYCDYYPVDLNLGMKKKVGIARALTMNPELILFDDPSLDLIGLARRRLEEHIIWLHDKLKITTVIVTNNLQFAKREADKILIMEKGRSIGFGALSELESGGDAKIKNFLVTGNLSKIF